MFSARFLLFACLLALLLATLVPMPTESKITYIKPLWQPVSEWSPPEAGAYTRPLLSST
jgi:hypothetical protein